MREVSGSRARVYSRDAVGYGCTAVHMRLCSLQRARPAQPLRNFSLPQRFTALQYDGLYIALIFRCILPA